MLSNDAKTWLAALAVVAGLVVIGELIGLLVGTDSGGRVFVIFR